MKPQKQSTPPVKCTFCSTHAMAELRGVPLCQNCLFSSITKSGISSATVVTPLTKF